MRSGNTLRPNCKRYKVRGLFYSYILECKVTATDEHLQKPAEACTNSFIYRSSTNAFSHEPCEPVDSKLLPCQIAYISL